MSGKGPGFAGMASQPRRGGGIGQVDDVAARRLQGLVVCDRMDAMSPGGRRARGGESQQHGADQFFGEGARYACAFEQAQSMSPGGQTDGPASRPAVEQLGVQGRGQGFGGEVGPVARQIIGPVQPGLDAGGRPAGGRENGLDAVRPLHGARLQGHGGGGIGEPG